MFNESSRATVLQLYKAFDGQNLEQAVALLDSSTFVAHLAGIPQPLDKEAFKQFGLSFYLAFSQCHHSFDQVIVADDKVVTSGTFTATHTGEFQGLPPTSKRISLSVMHIDQIKDGKIIRHWGQGDALGLMRQLGVVSIPGPTLLLSMMKRLVSR